ncbi:hypothetical protein GCM10023231_21680 [Olivibacter ginsenosidimutans]|uniref:DUF4397 domain-containing protein n=1 Tax=Olivibacter ginsenosidimutans TaxID=1176537 RepID=A0ABP9BB67_9SPHI
MNKDLLVYVLSTSMDITGLLKKKKNKWIYLFSVIIATLFLSSCLKDNDGENGDIPAALVSFVHSSPDAGELIVGVNGYQVNTQSFKFGDRIIYQYVYPGGNQFQINDASSNKKLDAKNWNLEGGACYSIFAVDRLDTIQLLGVKDFYVNDVPKDGFAKVRFINLCPDSVSLDLKANDIDTLLASQKKFKQNTTFGDIKADDNTSYDITIVNHATGSPLHKTTFKPKQGQYYTIMAAGLMDTEVEAQKLNAFILKHD